MKVSVILRTSLLETREAVFYGLSCPDDWGQSPSVPQAASEQAKASCFLPLSSPVKEMMPH